MDGNFYLFMHVQYCINVHPTLCPLATVGPLPSLTLDISGPDPEFVWREGVGERVQK